MKMTLDIASSTSIRNAVPNIKNVVVIEDLAPSLGKAKCAINDGKWPLFGQGIVFGRQMLGAIRVC
jgi:hypothetical protein